MPQGSWKPNTSKETETGYYNEASIEELTEFISRGFEESRKKERATLGEGAAVKIATIRFIAGSFIPWSCLMKEGDSYTG